MHIQYHKKLYKICIMQHCTWYALCNIVHDICTLENIVHIHTLYNIVLIHSWTMCLSTLAKKRTGPLQTKTRPYKLTMVDISFYHSLHTREREHVFAVKHVQVTKVAKIWILATKIYGNPCTKKYWNNSKQRKTWLGYKMKNNNINITHAWRVSV